MEAKRRPPQVETVLQSPACRCVDSISTQEQADSNHSLKPRGADPRVAQHDDVRLQALRRLLAAGASLHRAGGSPATKGARNGGQFWPTCWRCPDGSGRSSWRT